MSVHALLLNASWEPIRVVSARRAIQLIEAGKAEALELSDGEFHAATITIKVPRVLRLVKQVKIPFRADVPLSRKALFARDNFECQFTHCSRKATTWDHVHPRSKGGAHSWTNLVAACKQCNSKKDDKLLKDLGWSLKRQPYAPKGWFYVVFRFEVDEAWMPYLPAL